MIFAVEKDLPPTLVVAAAALVVGIGGCMVYAGAGLYYQARPVPLSTVRDSLVWRPPLVFRIAGVIVVVTFSTTFVALATIPVIWKVPLPLVISAGVGVLITWFISLRLLVARLEADRWGIRCTNPISTVRLPWGEIRSLEPRGRSMLSRRIVVVTQGRERMLWVWDPRVPVSPDAARLLVAELEAVRQSATTPHPNGIDLAATGRTGSRRCTASRRFSSVSHQRSRQEIRSPCALRAHSAGSAP
jgi:hypothetical protein